MHWLCIMSDVVYRQWAGVMQPSVGCLIAAVQHVSVGLVALLGIPNALCSAIHIHVSVLIQKVIMQTMRRSLYHQSIVFHKGT